MKANELRIGNYVECFGTRQVSVIKANKAKVYHENYGSIISEWCPINSLSLQGIPLTEEWLIKFGYTKYNKTTYYTKHCANNVMSVYVFDSFCRIQLTVLNICCIKYVHELQNLYFSLTGEELTLKN